MRYFMDEFYVRTAVWMCPFMMGIFFAYLLPKIQRASHSQQKKNVTIAMFLITSFYAIFYMLASQNQSWSTYAILQTITLIGMGRILSLLIFIFHSQSQFIDYELSTETSPLLVHLGRISYPLYLTHYLVLVAILNGTSLTPMMDMFSVICIIIGSLCIIHFIDIFVHFHWKTDSKYSKNNGNLNYITEFIKLSEHG